MSHSDVYSISVKQYYKVTTFASVGYILVDDVWVRKYESCYVGTPFSPKLHSFSPHFFGTAFVDAKLRLLEINSKIYDLKDLLLSTLSWTKSRIQTKRLKRKLFAFVSSWIKSSRKQLNL